MNWETHEVWQWLNTSEEIYHEVDELIQASPNPAERLCDWVQKGNAPEGLYKSFERPPKSSFAHVDWEALIQSWIA